MTSINSITADIYPHEAAFLSRVIYDYTSRPPGKIELGVN